MNFYATTPVASGLALARKYGLGAIFCSSNSASMFDCRFGLRIGRPDGNPRPCAELTLSIRSNDFRKVRLERAAICCVPISTLRRRRAEHRELNKCLLRSTAPVWLECTSTLGLPSNVVDRPVGNPDSFHLRGLDLSLGFWDLNHRPSRTRRHYGGLGGRVLHPSRSEGSLVTCLALYEAKYE